MRSDLKSQYFTQTILPQYMASHRQETVDWDVVYDARGHFAEPHTELIVPLGTLDVRGYLADVAITLSSPWRLAGFLPPRLLVFPRAAHRTALTPSHS